jgi:hypothetical protein
MRSTLDVWTYREGVDFGTSTSPRNVVGYAVEARDGSIGKVDDATYDTDSSYLVVDTGAVDLWQEGDAPGGSHRERRPRRPDNPRQPYEG